MTSPVSDIIDSIAARVRDDTNTQHSRVEVMDLVSRVQMLVNAQWQFKLSHTPLTMEPGVPIYELENDLDATLQVTEVCLGAKSLIHIRPWRNLWKLSRTWMTDRASQPRGWTQIGRTLLVLYPSTMEPTEVLVTGVQVTPTYVNEAETMVMRPENEDLVKDLVTALLLIKSRDLETAPGWINRMVARARLQLPEAMEQQRVEAMFM